MTEAESRGMRPQGQEAWSHRRLEKEGRTLPGGLRRDLGPPTFDSGLGASRTVRE